jgi:pimeloyl-ACP methyl ester carboxylesterase
MYSIYKMYVFASALLVYVSVIPMIISIIAIIIISTLFSIVVFPFIKHRNFSLLSVETSILEEHVKISEYKHTVAEFENYNIHSIIAHSPNRRNKPDLILVHGTMSGSMTFVKMLDHLSEYFTVHLIDLPGFGRSYASKDLSNMTQSEITDFYSRVLHTYIDKHCLNSVTIAGHSFGAFISINFASKHPELVNKMILIDPAGIFPLLGKYGAYWAIFFKFAIPQMICRSIGSLAPFIFHTFLSLTKCKENSFDYYFQLISSKSTIANLFAGRFINITFSRSSWSVPVLHTLANLEIPIGFIYGENDNIIPYHQGLVFSEITGNNIPVNIIQGAGHSPQCSHPFECASAIIDIYANTSRQVPIILSESIRKKIPYKELVKYDGSYNIKDTINAINKLYTRLLCDDSYTPPSRLDLVPLLCISPG